MVANIFTIIAEISRARLVSVYDRIGIFCMPWEMHSILDDCTTCSALGTNTKHTSVVTFPHVKHITEISFKCHTLFIQFVRTDSHSRVGFWAALQCECIFNGKIEPRTRNVHTNNEPLNKRVVRLVFAVVVTPQHTQQTAAPATTTFNMWICLGQTNRTGNRIALSPYVCLYDCTVYAPYYIIHWRLISWWQIHTHKHHIYKAMSTRIDFMRVPFVVFDKINARVFISQ